MLLCGYFCIEAAAFAVTRLDNLLLLRPQGPGRANLLLIRRRATEEPRSSQAIVETEAEPKSEQVSRPVGRVKGKAADRSKPIRQGRSSNERPQKNEMLSAAEQIGSVPQLILGGLFALFIARFVLGFGAMDNSAPQAYPQAYYFSSSRSMVSVTTTDINGDRRTTVNEDADVRTNIPGLKSYDRSTLPREYVPSQVLPPSSSLYPLLDFDMFP